MAKVKLKLEVWCSDPREFDNLMAMLGQSQIFECENGRYGGYGFELKVQDLEEDKIRKALGFKKSEI